MHARFRPARSRPSGLLVLLSGAVSTPRLSRPLSIVTQSGQRHAFQVEVARNDADRAQGLMFRRIHAGRSRHAVRFRPRSSPSRCGCRTPICPLDMLFIRADGTIARIAAEYRAAVDPHHPFRRAGAGGAGVVAGTAARLGIKPGDRVEHPLFKPLSSLRSNAPEPPSRTPRASARPPRWFPPGGRRGSPRLRLAAGGTRRSWLLPPRR